MVNAATRRQLGSLLNVMRYKIQRTKMQSRYAMVKKSQDEPRRLRVDAGGCATPRHAAPRSQIHQIAWLVQQKKV
jgi:hypothetical protein